MSCPTHGLSPVPAGECVGREPGMNERKVRGIENMIEIMVVVINLRGRELALINDVLARKGANVKPFGERTL